MSLVELAARNLLRNRFRTALTILGAALAVASFIIIRTVVDSYESTATMAAPDRVVTRHKVTFIMTLPRRYIDQVKEVPNIRTVTWGNWFGGKDPKVENDFFATIAVDPKTFFEVYYDLPVAPEVMARLLADRKAAVVGDVVAKAHGWKVGDTIHLTSAIFPGDWEFHIVGFYDVTNKSLDRRSVYFRWDYLNDSVPERMRDQIGWIIARMNPGTSPADVGAAIDKRFDDAEVQTLSQDEAAFNRSFLGMFSSVLTALDWASIIIILVLSLIVGNTIAMGVRERTSEYGVMRAIGFLPHHLVLLVTAESLVLGLLSGGLGLLLGYGTMGGLGHFIEENFGSILPIVVVNPATVTVALALAVVLAFAAAIFPARRVMRLNVLASLRRLG